MKPAASYVQPDNGRVISLLSLLYVTTAGYRVYALPLLLPTTQTLVSTPTQS